MDAIAPGLWRWTAPHPDWRQARKKDSASDWPRDVGCVLAETDGHVVLVDPLLVGDDQWAALDERVAGRPVHVLTMSPWHRRSRDEVLARYGGDRVAPAGVEVHRVKAVREAVAWLPEHRTLVPGDVLIAADGGKIRMCPESWLGPARRRIGHPELREALLPLLGLPVERVLVSHGAPVLGDGLAALRAALG